MNARILLTTSIVAFAASSIGAQSTAAGRGRTLASQVSEFTVAGIKVIHKPITANDVIAVRLYVKGGSAALTPETAGIERFIVAVSDRGTKKYDGDQIAARSTATGTQIFGESEYDFSVYAAQGVRQHWNETWDLFTQVALHPTFPESEVEQIRGQILNDLQQRTDNPDAHLELLADSLMYAGHAYALDPDGTTAAITKLTRDDLVRWHKRRLTKANLLIVVVGNVSRADLTTKIRAAFGSLPATGGSATKLTTLGESTPDVMVVKQELPTNYIMGVYAVPGPASPDFPAVRVATRVLSERLFEEVRTKRNLSYAVSSSIGTRTTNRGSLYVTAVDPDTTIKVMISEVKRLQSEPVPLGRLQQSINVFATGLLMGQQTSMGQAATLGLWELSGGGWRNGVSYVERLRKVTPAQVQQAATKYLRNARFVVIGDPARIERKSFITM